MIFTSKIRTLLIISILAIIVVSISSYSLVWSAPPSVYAFVSTDSPIYKPGDKIIVQAFLFPSSHQSFTVTAKFYFTDLPNAPSIPEKTVTVPPVDQSPMFIINSDPVTLPEVNDGFYHVRMELWSNGQKIADDTVEFKVVHGPPSGKAPMILFVWHNHQAPNYGPNGKFFSMWHIGHFFNDGLVYYRITDINHPDMGTYYLHLYLVEKYPHVKANLHYSPSLIYQLYYAAKHGFPLYDPTIGRSRMVKPGDPEAQKIMEFFSDLRKLHQQDRVYVMTSVFAHTIQGYVIERYKVDKLLQYDLELGKEWTTKLITSTDAMWTPEMAWSDALRPIYIDEGIKYTVLDGTHHFPGSKGDKGTIFEPYIVKDSRGRELIVFFRDQEVSDGYIGFTNNDWDNPRQADRDARALYYHIYDKHSFKNYQYPPLEVIAADGENWILFAPSAANGALFLDRIYAYIDKLTVEGIMLSGTFKDAVQYHPPQRVLDTITWTSWLGGWWKWTTQGGDVQGHAWKLVDERMAKYRAITYYLGIDSYSKFKGMINSNPDFNKSVIDLIHAIDSDYFWWEFFSEGYIESWLKQFDNDSLSLLNYKVNVKTEPDKTVAKVSNKLLVTITNENNYVMKDTTIIVSIPGLNSTKKTLGIDPGAETTLSIVFKPLRPGKVSVQIRMYNPGTIVSSIFFDNGAERTLYFHNEKLSLEVLRPVDLEVSASATDQTGVPAGMAPTMPGPYYISVLIDSEMPVEYNVPVKITLYVDDEKVSELSDIIPRGETSYTESFTINLEPGTHTYKVVVQSLYDPNNDNNVFEGQIIVSSGKTSGSNRGGGVPWDIIGVIILILAALGFLEYVLVRRR